MKSFEEFGIEIPYNRTSGNVKAFCPKCHEQRRDKRDKSLSVNIDRGIWHCHYCEWTGTLHVGERSQTFPKKEYRRPTLRPILPATPKIVEWFKSRGISQSTIEKMKIFEGERMMPQSGKKEPTIQFNYCLKDELINVKYRTYDKKFMLETIVHDNFVIT